MDTCHLIKTQTARTKNVFKKQTLTEMAEIIFGNRNQTKVFVKMLRTTKNPLIIKIFFYF